jgi:hypothetical protein
MVQSDVEVFKLHNLFQRVLYKWLGCSRYLDFNIEKEIPHLTIFVNGNSLAVVSSHENGFPRCSISLRKLVSCPLDYWEQGVADFTLYSRVCFYGRGELQHDFKRTDIGTLSIDWYLYISDILAPLNESQRFALEFTLKEVLKELEKELEYKQKQYYSLNTDFEQYKGLEFQEGFKRLD